MAVLKADGSVQETRVTKLFMFDGLKRVEIDEAAAGDIVCLAGIENITIGETITSPDHRVPIARIAVDEPTVSMIFGVNTSPMAGREGRTSPHETCATGSLASFWATCRRVEDTDTPEQVKVIGRGELQLSILIEMMRRRLRAPGVPPRHRDQGRRRREDGAGRGPRHRHSR